MCENDDTIREYESHLKQKEREYENICIRCGECCGATDGDPCVNLIYDELKQYYICKDYDNRLGKQKTISGKTFTCVPIEENIREGTAHESCMYVRKSKQKGFVL